MNTSNSNTTQDTGYLSCQPCMFCGENDEEGGVLFCKKTFSRYPIKCDEYVEETPLSISQAPN